MTAKNKQLTLNFPTEDITPELINDDNMSCSSHDIEEEYVFQFKGKRYECISETRDFDIRQFNILIEWKDYNTIKNRIVNQLMWGPNIREV
tara:strand:+ start:303 stop:575 length:273 start_codon:yes stop_codon:yes gene_type:complete